MDQVTRALPREAVERLERQQKKVEEAAAKEPPRFVASVTGQREVVVQLEFPVEYDGQTISEVTIRRPTMREWREWNRACNDAEEVGGPAASDLVDRPWLSIPAVVFENLDFMDASKVEAVEDGFFARSSLPREGVAAASSPQE